jgi:hypothetical protein
MKKICISVLFAIGTQVVVAQKSFILSHIDHRGFINLSGGVSMPIQSLMKADPTATSDVTALRGSSMQVSAGYRLGRFLGVMGSVTNCLNESGTGQMLQNIQKSHLGASWTANGGTWNCTHAMAGPYASFSAGLWMFDVRVSGGYSWIQRPSTELKGQYFEVPIYIRTSQLRAGGITAGVGTSIRCKITRNLAFAIHGDYVTTRASFNNVNSTLTIGKETVNETLREVHPIGLLNLNGGLSLLF